jgi:hypothetical protein
MQPLTPQRVLLVRKTVAGLVAVVALGVLFTVEYVTAAETEAKQPAGYFPAQFTIKPAADESVEPIPTF